jgi:hypothetical protein
LNQNYSNLVYCSRPIFDSVCAEYLGVKESIDALSYIMKEHNKTFEDVLKDYLRSIKKEKLYWLEGLYGSLSDLCYVSKETRDYLISYKWENLFLEKPFNKDGYPHYYWHGILERMFHNLVDHAREIESKCSKSN